MSRRPAGTAASTPALTVLREAGVVHTLHPYEQDPCAGLPYGHEAARALGVDPARVLKTLVVKIDRGGGRGGAVHLVIALVPVSTSLDLKALAATLGGKQASLAEPAAAERATGYVLGGISPLGQRRPLPTVVDSTAFDHATVLVSGGRRRLDIELRAGDLVAITGARTALIHR